jgi:TetR/AcrR family transcriptional repressor of nem operon
MSKADKTRQFIIEKTAVIFNKKGFAGTSLTDLTAATGLTKGALYGNFRNKDEIALAAYDFNARLVTAAFTGISTTAQTATDELLLIASFYKTQYNAIAAQGGCPILNTAVEADDNQPHLKKKVNSSIKSCMQHFEKIMRRGLSNKEIKPGIQPSRYAGIFLSLLEGGVMLSKITGDRMYINEAADTMMRIIEKELRL